MPQQILFQNVRDFNSDGVIDDVRYTQEEGGRFQLRLLLKGRDGQVVAEQIPYSTYATTYPDMQIISVDLDGETDGMGRPFGSPGDTPGQCDNSKILLQQNTGAPWALARCALQGNTLVPQTVYGQILSAADDVVTVQFPAN